MLADKIVPIAANKKLKWEPTVVRLDQPNYGTSSTETHEETAEERNAQMTILGCSTKKTTSRKPAKKAALHQKRSLGAKKDSNKIVETFRYPPCARVLDFIENFREEDVANFVPAWLPFDLSATTLEAAYPLDKIISEDEWGYLLDVLDLSNAGAEVASDVYPGFVCSRVHKLNNIKDGKEKRKLAGIFSYITHLIRFNDKFSFVHFPATAKDHDIPDILFRRFSSMFIPDHNGRMHRLYLYVLVLTLHADNFRTNTNDISEDLRVFKGSLESFYRLLGCNVKEDEVTLSLPVQFPQPKAFRPAFVESVKRMIRNKKNPV